MVHLLTALFVLGPPRQAPTVVYLNPSWSPNGKAVLFESNRDGGKLAVYSIGADGSGLRRLTPEGATAEQPAFRPDGKRIVFRSDRDGESPIGCSTVCGTSATKTP